jgi:hypothetical protein
MLLLLLLFLGSQLLSGSLLLLASMNAAVVLTAVDVPRVPAIAGVSAEAAVPTAVNVPPAFGMVFPTFLASLL